MHVRSALILLLAFSMAAAAVAQQDGSLRGYITDDTGAALPGVTVTASSDVLIGGTRSAVTDSDGLLPAHQSPPWGLLDHRRAPELRDLSTGGHPGPRWS